MAQTFSKHWVRHSYTNTKSIVRRSFYFLFKWIGAWITKQIYFAFLFVSSLHAQGVSDSTAVEYTDIVVVDSLSKQILFNNANRWIASLKKQDEKISVSLNDSIHGKLLAQSEFDVYSQSGILKKMSGVISYSISIEVKDNKYKYVFNNFIFHYYRQNKNYIMMKTGKIKPLSDTRAPGWLKLWTQHKATTASKMKSNIEQLQIKMTTRPKKKSEILPRKKIEW